MNQRSATTRLAVLAVLAFLASVLLPRGMAGEPTTETTVLREAQGARGEGNARVAAGLYRKAASMARESGHSDTEEEALEGLFAVLTDVEDYRAMPAVLRRLRALQDARKDSVAVLKTDYDLSTVEGLLGHPEAAAEELGRILGQMDGRATPQEVAQARVTRALLLLRSDQEPAALRELLLARQALAPLVKAGALDAETRAVALYAAEALLEIRRDEEDLPGVIAIAEEVLRLVGSPPSDRRLHAVALEARGAARLGLGRTEEGIQDLRGAQAEYRECGLPGNACDVSMALASARQVAGDVDGATKAFRSLARDESVDPTRRLVARLRYANALFEGDHLERALDLYDCAVQGLARPETRHLEVFARAGRAEVLLRLDRLEQAVADTRAALALARKRLPGRAAAALRKQIRIASEADTGLTAAWKADRPDLFYEFYEASRGRAMLESLEDPAVLRHADVPEVVARGERDAAEALAVAEVRFEDARREGLTDKRRVAQDEVDRARDAYDEAGGAIDEWRQREGRPDATEVVSRAQLATYLPTGTALVSYALLPERLVAEVRTGDTPRLVDLGDRKTSDALVERLRTLPDLEQKEANALLVSCAKQWITPLGLPPETRLLLVCPDQSMGLVPFPALLASSGEGEDVAVVDAPSASAYVAWMSRMHPPGERMLAVGDPAYSPMGPYDPLSGTGVEIRDAAREGDELLLREHATEGEFKEALRAEHGWAVVHVGCHGLVDGTHPAWSALALLRRPGSPDDGLLTVGEILRLPVQADLVVLSCCESGAGRPSPGAGVLGLHRAFLLSGADRVVANLWPIPDRSGAKWMKTFYEHVHRGVPPARALVAAERALRAEHPHPKDWAGWVLWGRSD